MEEIEKKMMKKMEYMLVSIGSNPITCHSNGCTCTYNKA